MNSRVDPVVRQDISVILAACGDQLAQLRGKTLLLTGASGFVGSYLLESLIALNAAGSGMARCRVLLPTRSLTATRAKWPHFFGVPDIEWFEWDGGAFSPDLGRCDFLIHAASPSDPAQYLDHAFDAMLEMVSATRHVLDFARQAEVRRVLYLSSGAVYGAQPGDLPAMPESYLGAPDQRDPRSCYGEAKRYCELLCRVSGVPSVIGRLFSFIGPYQDLTSSFAAPDFIRQASTQGHIRIRGDGSAIRTYCYASELTIALWKLLLNGESGEVYNVGQGEPAVSILDLARVVADVVGGTEITVEGRELPNSAVRMRYVPDISKLSVLFRPSFALEEAMARTVTSLYNSHRISKPPRISCNVALEAQ
jgi:UDP-glucuronate decarboxylase